MKKTLIWIVVIGLLAFGIYALVGNQNKATVIEKDLVVEGDYQVPAKTELVFKNNAKLMVKGNLTTDGNLSCDGGPLSIEVDGNATFNGTLKCSRGEDAEGAGAGITLVVKGSLAFSKDATVISNSHVQIVNDAAKLLATENQIKALYKEAGENTGKGPRIGPFIENGQASVSSGKMSAKNSSDISAIFSFVEKAYAAPTDNNGNVIPSEIIRGHWYIGEGGNPPPGINVGKPPKGVHHIILNFDFGLVGDVNLQDFYLAGPDGEDGATDVNKKCNAKGENGKDAMRFRVQARDIDINNFTIQLGNGGAGGEAETIKECDPGIATGGAGGQAGNFKMTAQGKISIASMKIIPGVGGNGGDATAHGKNGADGCPGKKGGDATATGGKGGDNKKNLSADGAVAGIENISVTAVVGGIGGYATADPGKGGNCTGCNCNGGQGGKGTATAGAGGDASVKVQGGSADANGGNGGDADAKGGNGGTGGMCPLKPTGGNGGNGGDAKAKEGKGGKGTSSAGDDGRVKNEIGGDGGNGGDGCGPGGGGKGGAAKTPGKDGSPGKKECPLPPETKTSIIPETKTNTTGKTDTTSTGGTSSGGTGTTQTGTAGGTQTGTTGGTQTQIKPQTIKAIHYQGKFIPTSELTVMTHSGCDEQAHWHSKPTPGGPVKATDGSTVMDPGPECGFGTTASVPVIDVPATTE